MTDERMLEDLVGLLTEEKNWVKGSFPLVESVYTTTKDGLRFSAYKMNFTNSYHLSIMGNDISESFDGELVKSLYESLVESYGGLIDVKLLKKERQETALKLALSKLRGE